MSSISRFNRLLSLFMVAGWLLSTISGCMVGPDFHPPRPAAPSSWAGVGKTSSEVTSIPTSQPAKLARWWEQFHDPLLTSLVEEALRKNLSLELALSRLRQARAAERIAVAGLWPTIGGSAEVQRETSVLHQSQAGKAQNLYEAGFDAAWELDFFGGQRRSIESAKANTQAAFEGIRDVQVSIAAEVALDYVQLRQYQQEIIVAQKNLKARQDADKITRLKANAGFDSALDIANADAAVATTEAQIPVFEAEARQSIYALSVLLARPPAALVKQLAPTGRIPSVPARIPAGLPSELLRRRPDIREVEAQLHAATAQIGVATAQLFPQFSLTGSVGWESSQFSSWWSVANRAYSMGPSVEWPIFQGGAIISNIHVQQALRDQAFINYRQTVLSAFQDVENALVAFTREQEHYKSLKDSVIANRKAFDLSLKLYTEGLLEFLNVLVAEESLYTAEDALVQSRSNITQDLIALYKALGGGWEADMTAGLQAKAGADKR